MSSYDDCLDDSLVSRSEVLWVTLLFRGSKRVEDGPSEQTSLALDGVDEYVTEFEANNLPAINLPILEFSFKNLDQLSIQLNKVLEDDPPNSTSNKISGLIITSPRAVEGLDIVLKQLPAQKEEIISRIDDRFVFVVGEKTAKECERLGLKYNSGSPQTGSGDTLAEYIRSFCDEISSQKERAAQIELLYLKGNLSDERIENLLENSNLKVDTIIIYETIASNSIESDILERLRGLSIPESKRSVIINHAFFSPSGVDSFCQIVLSRYKSMVQDIMPSKTIELRYSAIGKTTEAALRRNRMKVFSVAAKPNATSLVKALKDNIYPDT